MDLVQLRYFVAVAETGSFSRAAERCFKTQPALSRAIASLEEELNQRLFDRIGRRALLTDAGRLLLDRARRILEEVDDTERRLRDSGDLHGSRLTVGAIPTIAPYLLPRALDRFLRKHPEVELTAQEDVTRNLIEATARGEVDLAVVALPIDDDRLEVEPLWSEELLLALPRGHRLARRRNLSVGDLTPERFILLQEVHCLGEQVLSYCRAHECHPRIACRSAQIATIQSLIALGQGVSLLPEMARRGDTNCVYRRLTSPAPSRTLAVMWRRHRYHSIAAEQFLDVLRSRAST
jgi:LysR family transcriptional regulator, hydrogen peroxide-inducible genes activator